ncbi:MAG: hypothetical protein M1821_001722 [Bathelium mastoideum]|nr:MAG: hypothetical protein M1821_001722 [Bathelium mastoideum]KAI9691620.1 MAG: hypothetical protein M1822_007691 [Bathelium mastoideum]
MDFWSRLIGGAGSEKRQPAPNNPQQRLARFRRIYNQTLQIWHKKPSLSSDTLAIDNVRSNFQRLTSYLHDESRSPAPHLCISYAASSQIYTTIARVASVSQNEGIVREAVAFYGALIDSEEEDFLATPVFAGSLMAFVGRLTGSGAMLLGIDTSAEIVELLFGIAAKIRLEPEILPIWFTSETRIQSQKASFAGVTQKDDFPLCYQLIDHVHHEGRIGDFARTGLLYIFESAAHSKTLEQWLVESDMPTLMATGLGALYSQLSRKLSILHPAEELPVILSLSDYADLQPSKDAESLFSPTFTVEMDTFLSYLAFWQDVLQHCKSDDVKATLIDHFQILFLQQLLYPSLLESSDVDGGSSVAVLTYLRRILDSLEHPDLVHMILQYLLALPEPASSRPTLSARSPSIEQRRMSLMLLNEPEKEEDKLSPSLFNLVDLIINSLTSKNTQTVISALKLVSLILDKDHVYAVSTLVRSVPCRNKSPQRTIGGLDAEVDAYLALAEGFGGFQDLEQAYGDHLSDVQMLLETHPCSARILTPQGVHNPTIAQHPSSTLCLKPVDIHYLSNDDPMFTSFLRLLETFFTNNVETNLGLTDAIISLASCPCIRLEGWLAIDPLKYQFPDQSNALQSPFPIKSPTAPTTQPPSSQFDALHLARRRPLFAARDTPPLLATLRSLIAQLQLLRTEIPTLDTLIQNRKEVFQVTESLDAVTTDLAPPRSSRPSSDTPRAAAAATPTTAADRGVGPTVPKLESVPQHALARSASPSRSRTASPRGRHPASEAPAGAGVASSPAPSSSSRRREPPTLAGGPSAVLSPDRAAAFSSPLRGAGSPRGGGGPGTPWSGGGFEQLSPAVAELDAKVLRRRLRFPLGGVQQVENERKDDEGGRVREDRVEGSNVVGTGGAGSDKPEGAEASLNHVLTNIVILQEFVLEIAAVLQVRGHLFEDVRFV